MIRDFECKKCGSITRTSVPGQIIPIAPWCENCDNPDPMVEKCIVLIGGWSF
jgi:hypothetical protein